MRVNPSNTQKHGQHAKTRSKTIKLRVEFIGVKPLVSYICRACRIQYNEMALHCPLLCLITGAVGRVHVIHAWSTP